MDDRHWATGGDTDADDRSPTSPCAPHAVGCRVHSTRRRSSGRCAETVGGTIGVFEPRPPRPTWPIGPRPLMSLAAIVMLCAMIAVGCGGSSTDRDASGGEGDAIEGPVPPATSAVAPTATSAPTTLPTATAAIPTPTPIAEPGPEAEVIAAWERYLRLSIEARGKNPSPEALDFDSYSWGDARAALIQELADDRAAGRFVTGSTDQRGLVAEIRPDGVGVVELCIITDWVLRSRIDDSTQVEEGEVRHAARARIDPQQDGHWLVAATEFSIGCS